MPIENLGADAISKPSSKSYKIFYSLAEFVNVDNRKIFFLLGFNGRLMSPQQRIHLTRDILDRQVNPVRHHV